MKDLHHDNAVLAQQGIDERLSKQHPIRHILDSRSFFAAEVFEPNGITNLLSKSAVSSMQYTNRCIRETSEEETRVELTSSPRIVPTSAATRLATEVAATRRGCVHAMTFPELAHPASYRYCGNSVCIVSDVFSKSVKGERVAHTSSLPASSLSNDNSYTILLNTVQKLLAYISRVPSDVHIVRNQIENPTYDA